MKLGTANQELSLPLELCILRVKLITRIKFRSLKSRNTHYNNRSMYKRVLHINIGKILPIPKAHTIYHSRHREKEKEIYISI